MWITRREHQQPALAGAAHEHKSKSNIRGLGGPAVTLELLELRGECVLEIRACIEALAVNYFPLQIEDDDESRLAVDSEDGVMRALHAPDFGNCSSGRLFSSGATKTLYVGKIDRLGWLRSGDRHPTRYLAMAEN